MRVMYVSGPFGHDDKIHGVQRNIIVASEVSLRLWANGWAVICPHKNTADFQHTRIPWDTWMAGDLEFVRRSDAVMMLPGWELSPGAKLERNEALARGIPVYYYSIEQPLPVPQEPVKEFAWPRKL